MKQEIERGMIMDQKKLLISCWLAYSFILVLCFLNKPFLYFDSKQCSCCGENVFSLKNSNKTITILSMNISNGNEREAIQIIMLTHMDNISFSLHKKNTCH